MHDSALFIPPVYDISHDQTARQIGHHFMQSCGPQETQPAPGRGILSKPMQSAACNRIAGMVVLRNTVLLWGVSGSRTQLRLGCSWGSCGLLALPTSLLGLRGLGLLGGLGCLLHGLWLGSLLCALGWHVVVDAVNGGWGGAERGGEGDASQCMRMAHSMAMPLAKGRDAMPEPEHGPHWWWNVVHWHGPLIGAGRAKPISPPP